MSVDRRRFAQMAGLSVLATGLGLAKGSRAELQGSPSDYQLRIVNGLVELAPDRIISTTTYNGQFPGPLLRLKQGREVIVDINNDTDSPEQLHWHGLRLPTDLDGAAEEGTPFIPAHGYASGHNPGFVFGLTPPGATVQSSAVEGHSDKPAGIGFVEPDEFSEVVDALVGKGDGVLVVGAEHGETAVLRFHLAGDVP